MPPSMTSGHRHRRGGSERPPILWIVAVVVVVAVVAGLAFVLLRGGGGERDRSAYCSALKQLDTPSGLARAAATAPSAKIAAVTGSAPGRLAPAWDYLADHLTANGVERLQGAAGARLESDVELIVQDASDNCGFALTR
jgi:hypothetical protein